MIFFFHIPYRKINQYIPYINARALNLEIYFSAKDIDNLEKEDIKSLKESIHKKAKVQVHGPFMDLSPGAVDKKIRDVTVERFLQTLEIASLLEAEQVVFHSGYEKWKYRLRFDLWLEGSLITWNVIGRKARDSGIMIAIENVFEETPENLIQLMRALRDENIGICFDTGHYNIFGNIALRQWLEMILPYLKELHLHDNNRKADQHIALGDGCFDFDTLFDVIANRDIHCTVEAHSKEDAERSIEYLTKRGLFS